MPSRLGSVNENFRFAETFSVEVVPLRGARCCPSVLSKGRDSQRPLPGCPILANASRIRNRRSCETTDRANASPT